MRPSRVITLHGAPMNTAPRLNHPNTAFDRNRLQRLFSTTFFICFLVLFFDNKPHRRRPITTTNISPRDVSNMRYSNQEFESFVETEEELAAAAQHELEMKYLVGLLSKMMTQEDVPPLLNTTGIFSGQWNHTSLSLVTKKTQELFPPTTVVPYLNDTRASLILGSNDDHHLTTPSLPENIPSGALWLFLTTKNTSEPLLNDKVSYVEGQVIVHDHLSAFATRVFTVQGVLFRETGQLTLYGNHPHAAVQLVYPTMTTMRDGNESDAKSSMDISPDTRKRSSPLGGREPARFRTQPRHMGNVCYYRMDMKVKLNSRIDSSSTTKDNLDVVLSNGTLSSENCDVYMDIAAKFEEKDLRSFFSKASDYAILMASISTFQIYLLLTQLQYSGTQAMAAKVSLLTIGLQAIVDSYLCLFHLTAGIIAQSLFSSFSTIAFLKLIIFSIFEMRYLLSIWKARRPESFSNGWIVMRRELTTLYSRFYGALLCGIFISYNGWSYIDWIVLLAYSFWVPQIIHNAHREVKRPFHPRYLFGMSASRLFLPLYLRGCPANFLSAFPMYQEQVNPHMCLVLVSWIAFQISVLLLQDRLGSRFFIPARFLPVKYNYERRIEAQQLSLLCAQDSDVIDCVICMNPLDLELRNYMIAPCDHVFHRECLEEWMEVKMECPTCRCSLPPA